MTSDIYTCLILSFCQGPAVLYHTDCINDHDCHMYGLLAKIHIALDSLWIQVAMVTMGNIQGRALSD